MATEQSAARTVEATINDVAPGSFIDRRLVAPGAEHNTGRYEAHRVAVHDGRALRNHFSLDVQGFLLADRPSAVIDFFDREQVDRLYPGEVVDTVRSLTGATRVAPLGWMIRTSGDVARHQRQTNEGYTHRAFSPPPQDFPLAMCDARARESIEFRMIAYFE